MDAYNKTLSEQEDKKKSVQQEFAEYQAKIADSEEQLEKSSMQLKLLKEQNDQQMKKNEMLTTSYESTDLANRVEGTR